MPIIELPGCTPEPLMSYLKALGILRLVSEQADPSATLCWRGGVAHLDSRLDHDDLLTFFRDDYQPTPIIAPWNGGSGFYDSGTQPLEAIETSTVDRLAHYRETIATVRPLIPKVKPKDDDKEALLASCRAILSDIVVPWLDVCFVLGESGPGFFPLLGTGGNDGRLDFTNNFFQRLADVVPFRQNAPRNADSEAYLDVALYGDRSQKLVSLGKTAIGQFNPGGIGGPNGVQGSFDASSRVNPWDFVLMIEGALLFAGSVSRRMGAASVGRAVFPFTVESVAVGYGSATASEETTDGSRAELWLPLWDNPTSLFEVRHLFAEGRAQLGRRQARNAIEFALAVNLLGVSRGISTFSRYGFLKRNGLAFLAAPLGRVPVTLRPTARLLDDPVLSNWVKKLREACRDKDKTPVRYQAVLRQIDRTMFEFANRSEQGNDAPHLLNVLRALGQAEQTLARGLSFCKEKHLRPLHGLDPQWLDQANDGSPEFRLSVALAGVQGSRKQEIHPLRVYLEKVNSIPNWEPSSPSAVWTNQSLAANLAAVFRRRQLEAFQAGLTGVPLYCHRPARWDDVALFLHGRIDEEKLADLLWGLLGVHWKTVEYLKPERSHRPIPAEFGLCRLLVESLAFSPEKVHDRWLWNLTRTRTANAVADAEVFYALASDRPDAVATAITCAARRLRAGGLNVIGYRNRAMAGRPLETSRTVHPERLLASMLFPLANRDFIRIANTVLFPPDIQE